jgi:hypothetical protein
MAMFVPSMSFPVAHEQLRVDAPSGASLSAATLKAFVVRELNPSPSVPLVGTVRVAAEAAVRVTAWFALGTIPLVGSVKVEAPDEVKLTIWFPLGTMPLDGSVRVVDAEVVNSTACVAFGMVPVPEGAVRLLIVVVVAAPSVGVTSVGEVAKTTAPVPVVPLLRSVASSEPPLSDVVIVRIRRAAPLAVVS